MSPPFDASTARGAPPRPTPAVRRWLRRRFQGPASAGISTSALVIAAMISATIAGIAPACTRVSDTQRFPLVTDRLTIARTIPEQGEVIALDAQIDFCFSGYVDPRALDDFDASLSSGAVTFDTELELQLFAWSPPGASGDSAEAWCPGSVLSVRPKTPLRPGALHHLRLAPSAVGWAGEQLDVTTPGWVEGEAGFAFLLEFISDPTTLTADSDSDSDGDSDSDSDSEPGDTDGDVGLPAPTLRDLFAPGQVFSPANPACSCHRGDADDLARERLDLSNPDTAFADLVLPTRLMATGFPMVAPRRPAESYLVQTLLRDPDGTALYGVLGEPMPPDEPLPHADMVALVRWIEGGALP